MIIWWYCISQTLYSRWRDSIRTRTLIGYELVFIFTYLPTSFETRHIESLDVSLDIRNDKWWQHTQISSNMYMSIDERQYMIIVVNQSSCLHGKIVSNDKLDENPSRLNLQHTRVLCVCVCVCDSDIMIDRRKINKSHGKSLISYTQTFSIRILDNPQIIYPCVGNYMICCMIFQSIR